MKEKLAAATIGALLVVVVQWLFPVAWAARNEQYRVLDVGSLRVPQIQQALNAAAAEGWVYVGQAGLGVVLRKQ